MSKVEKRYLKGNGEYKLNVDEMVKAVNALDKEFGISLKNSNVWNEPDKQIKLIIESCNINLAALVVLMNGIKFTNYFDINAYGTITPYKTIGNESPLFNEDSLLKWNQTNVNYNTDSLLFRARFVSNVFQYMFGSFNKIINNSVAGCKHSKSENGIINCRNYMNYFIRFAEIMISPDSSYKNIILMMHEITSYKYKKVNHKSLKYMINSSIISLRINMNSNLITDRFYSDDMAIYNILKIAYMLATNNEDTSCLPKFKYIENATVEHDLIKLIEELGNQIIANNGYKKYPIMFRAYINAKPIIKSQFFDKAYENIAIRTGIAALGYTKFVIDDREISNFIDEMLKKGI